MYEYTLLQNIQKAAECAYNHIASGDEIALLVDSDVDGYTSAACVYSYIKNEDEKTNVTYYLHSGKEHGLSDEIKISSTAKLLIIPDAGSSDVKQCKALKQANPNLDIIILDHHESNCENPYAIVVNNQLCDYPNKNLSGVGIAYKFLQALDDFTFSFYADHFVDLVSLGNIADVMDMRERETKYLADFGLAHITNKLFEAFVKKQDYSIGGQLTVTGVQFYIVPYINAVIRAGTQEEKHLLFEAFIENDQWFPYKKRGETNVTQESIYDRVVRLSSNIKARQNKNKDKAILAIQQIISRYKLDENKIIFCPVGDVLDQTLTGVTAIKIAEKYNRPCLLLRPMKNNAACLGGSGRNLNNGYIQDLKQFLENLHVFNSVQGHANAFGVEIEKEKIKEAILASNDALKDASFEKYYMVDFEIDYNNLDVTFVREIDKLKRLYGQKVEEPLIFLKNVAIKKSGTQLIGKTSTTWKYKNEFTDVELICFANENDEILAALNDFCDDTDTFVLNAVGKASVNRYKGMATAQFLITDYEVVSFQK